MSEPVRIQRKRSKGWKMPPGTIYVGRPTQWGNVFKAADHGSASRVVDMERHDLTKFECFHPEKFRAWISPLRGKNLACWCALDQPCHADILLELANRDETQP